GIVPLSPWKNPLALGTFSREACPSSSIFGGLDKENIIMVNPPESSARIYGIGILCGVISGVCLSMILFVYQFVILILSQITVGYSNLVGSIISLTVSFLVLVLTAGVFLLTGMFASQLTGRVRT